MSKKESHKKELSGKESKEEKGKSSSPERVKPQKRKEGIEVKDDGVYFDVKHTNFELFLKPNS